MQVLGDRTRAGKITYDFPYTLIAKDGSVKHFLVDSDANMLQDGRVHFTRTFFRYDVEGLVSEAIERQRMDKMALVAAEKDRFIRVMFHEIRTPLHTLSNCYQTLLKQNPKLQSSATDEMTYMVGRTTNVVNMCLMMMM